MTKTIAPADAGLAVLGRALMSTLGAIWAEWHHLPDAPTTARNWDRFVQNITTMSAQTFIHPELVADPRLFGNRWTI